jgi:hypothetical protein
MRRIMTKKVCITHMMEIELLQVISALMATDGRKVHMDFVQHLVVIGTMIVKKT